MTTINKHGLSRYVPEKIERALRKESGYGCVVCGNAIYQYEHIDPEFNDAHEHCADNMTILCGSCHFNVTKKIWSKEKIKQAKLAPYCIKHGKANDFLDLPTGPIGLNFGNSHLAGNTILRIDGRPIIWFEDAEEAGTPRLLCASFYDKQNVCVLNIIRNEVRIYQSGWDVTTSGTKIKIGNPKEKQVLTMERVGGSEIKILECNMQIRDTSIQLKNDGSFLVHKNGKEIFHGSNLHAKSVDTAIKIGATPKSKFEWQKNISIAAILGKPIYDIHGFQICSLVPINADFFLAKTISHRDCGKIIFDRNDRPRITTIVNNVIDVDGNLCAISDNELNIWRIGTGEFLGKIKDSQIVVDSKTDPLGIPAFSGAPMCARQLITKHGIPISTRRILE